MKMSRILLLSALAILFLACGSSKKVKQPNSALDEMMAQKAFEIKIKTAEPLVTQAMSRVANSGILPPGNTINRIDVTGQGYYVRIQGDSVSAELPYFGERQMGGGYDSDAGIKFEGITENLELTKDETKQRYSINFSIPSSAENYFVTISVENNFTSTTAIRSSQRHQIRYSGNVGSL